MCTGGTRGQLPESGCILVVAPTFTCLTFLPQPPSAEASEDALLGLAQRRHPACPSPLSTPSLGWRLVPGLPGVPPLLLCTGCCEEWTPSPTLPLRFRGRVPSRCTRPRCSSPRSCHLGLATAIFKRGQRASHPCSCWACSESQRFLK